MLIGKNDQEGVNISDACAHNTNNNATLLPFYSSLLYTFEFRIESESVPVVLNTSSDCWSSLDALRFFKSSYSVSKHLLWKVFTVWQFAQAHLHSLHILNTHLSAQTGQDKVEHTECGHHQRVFLLKGARISFIKIAWYVIHHL